MKTTKKLKNGNYVAKIKAVNSVHGGKVRLVVEIRPSKRGNSGIVKDNKQKVLIKSTLMKISKLI